MMEGKWAVYNNQVFVVYASTNNKNPVERNRPTCIIFIMELAIKNVIFYFNTATVGLVQRVGSFKYPQTVLCEFGSLSPARTFVEPPPA